MTKRRAVVSRRAEPATAGEPTSRLTGHPSFVVLFARPRSSARSVRRFEALRAEGLQSPAIRCAGDRPAPAAGLDPHVARWKPRRHGLANNADGRLPHCNCSCGPVAGGALVYCCHLPDLAGRVRARCRKDSTHSCVVATDSNRLARIGRQRRNGRWVRS